MHQLEDTRRTGGALTERLHLLVPMLVIKEQLFERRRSVSLGIRRVTAWERAKSWARRRYAHHFGVWETGLLVQLLEVLNLRTCVLGQGSSDEEGSR